MKKSKDSLDKELEFLSGRFQNYQPAKAEQYLLHYFKTELQSMFLKYYCVFEDIDHFTRRTGHVCSRRALEKLRVRLKTLRSAHAEAKENMEFSILASIEQGKFKV